jgi:hypothetical protein
MSSALRWVLAVLIALAALIGLIAFLNSRDTGGVNQETTSSAAGPGSPYRGTPALSAALQSAVKRGNIVLLYRDATPPPGTEQLVPPGGKALVQAGQGVVLQREPQLQAALAAVSAKKIEEADRPQQLQQFVDYWLGGR